MGRNLDAGESKLTRHLFALTVATVVAAMCFGGGQGSPGELMVAIAGLVLAILACIRLNQSGAREGRLLWFCLLPAGLVMLPLLQLVPLPSWVWTHLPGRGAIARDLVAAGIPSPGGSWTLAPLSTERIFWTSLVPAGVFMAASVLHRHERRRLVTVCMCFAAMSAVLGLWQLMEGSESNLYFYRVTNKGEAVGLFANRNHLAGFLAAMLPVAAGALVDRARHRRHTLRDFRVWMLTSLIVLLAVTVTATHSRAGFALLMLSVVNSAVVVLRSRHQGGVGDLRSWLRMGAVLAGVMIIQFTLYGLLARLEADPLDDLRWKLAANTIAVAGPAMGTGFGLGSFADAYDEIGDDTTVMPSYVNHAHNDYLELWLEGGVPALALIVAALAMLAWQVRDQFRSRDAMQQNPSDHPGLKFGAVFSLFLIALHSLVDYPLRTLTIETYAALLAAVILGSVRISGRTAQP